VAGFGDTANLVVRMAAKGIGRGQEDGSRGLAFGSACAVCQEPLVKVIQGDKFANFSCLINFVVIV
jgi:hypothetical protein